jgi:type IX secretion system substrate protein
MKKIFRIFIISLSFILSNCFTSSATIYNITNSDSLGVAQFVNAIDQANLTTTQDTIHFNITGLAPYLFPFSATPTLITNPIVINGFSQPGNDTISWDIVFTGNVRFYLHTSHVSVQGIKFIAQYANPFIFRTAFEFNNDSAAGWGGYIQDFNFEENYFKGFNTVFSFDLKQTLTLVTIRKLIIHNNFFVANNATIDFPNKSWFRCKKIRFSKNYLYGDNSLLLHTNRQSAPHKIKIVNNNFVSSHLYSDGMLSHSFFSGNLIQGASVIQFEGECDSLVISNNDFNNASIYSLNIQYYSGQSKGLYIINNKFYNQFEWGIRVHSSISSSGLAYLDNVFIEGNELYNTKGILIHYHSFGGYCTGNNLSIKDNLLITDTINSQNAKIKLRASSGVRNLDSVLIENNTILGGNINIEIARNGSQTTVSDYVRIRKNTIKSSSEPGIYILNGNCYLSNYVIDSNFVSNCLKGISWLHGSAVGFYAKSQFVNIKNNKLSTNIECGLDLEFAPYYSGNSLVDSFYIYKNVIASNSYDGLRLTSNMVHNGFVNNIKNIRIEQNKIYNNVDNGISYMHNGDTASVWATPIIEDITITQNQIYNNRLKGISIVNLDDPGVPTSPIYPIPTIQSITAINDDHIVYGQLLADPNSIYNIELFSNSIPDTSGNGEGENFVQSMYIYTNSQGLASFQLLVNDANDSSYYSATSTSVITGNTSEFSNTKNIASIPRVFNSEPIKLVANSVLHIVKLLNLQSNYNYLIEVFDISGKKVISKNINAYNPSLNVEMLSSGIYIYNIRTTQVYSISKKGKFIKSSNSR